MGVAAIGEKGLKGIVAFFVEYVPTERVHQTFCLLRTHLIFVHNHVTTRLKIPFGRRSQNKGPATIIFPVSQFQHILTLHLPFSFFGRENFSPLPLQERRKQTGEICPLADKRRALHRKVGGGGSIPLILIPTFPQKSLQEKIQGEKRGGGGKIPSVAASSPSPILLSSP